jgi:WD40 repeat protein
LQTGQELRRFEAHTDMVWDVRFSPDGQTAFSASGDGTVIRWDLRTGQILRRYGMDGDTPVWKLAISGDGHSLLIGNYWGMIHLIDVETGKAYRHFTAGHDALGALAFGSGEQTVYAVTMVSDAPKEMLVAWDIATGREIERFEVTQASSDPRGDPAWVAHLGQDIRVALNPEANEALGIFGSQFVLWNLKTGVEIRRFQSIHTGWITNLTISPDGRAALSTSFDTLMVLWNLETGEVVRSFRGHGAEVTGAVFTPDGRHAVSISTDKMARLWDLDGGNELNCLHLDSFDQMRGVAISPDGVRSFAGRRLWAPP